MPWRRGTNTFEVLNTSAAIPVADPPYFDSGQDGLVSYGDFTSVFNGPTQFMGPLIAASGRPWIDILAFGADPTGVRDSTDAIQSALYAAASGTVYVPPGNYQVSLQNSPASGYLSCLIIPGYTTMQGGGRGASTIFMAANQTTGNDVSGSNSILINQNITNGGDEQITISDLTFDGNASNQTHTHEGVSFLRARGVRLTRVCSTNFRGTANSGTNETFHISFTLGADFSGTDCEVVGTSGTTASGFSFQGSTNGRYTGCTAFGMTMANGFTHNNCSHVAHVNCNSYLNGGNGFNSEVSTSIVYSNCVGGGVSANAAAYPFAANTSLGNGQSGFTINGTTLATLQGCVGQNNDDNGVSFTTSSSGQILGGAFIGNTNFGVSTGAQQEDISIDAGTIIGSNGLHPVSVGGANILNWPMGPGSSITPSVPSSGTAVINPYPFRVAVCISGGTVTSININGTATAAGLTSGIFILPVLGSITWNGSASPSWEWYGA